MGFQIKDKSGRPIPIQYLDREAAAFWGNQEVDPKYYASPDKGPKPEGIHEIDWEMLTGVNWFDSIGWNIHSPKSDWTRGWNNIKCSMWIVQTAEYGMMSFDEQNKRLPFTQKYLKPYFDLIDHWEAKGYTPHKVDD